MSLATFEWIKLERRDSELGDARLQCHYAIQLNTRLARGYVPARADDSHTNLSWHASTGELRGQAVGQGARAFQLGLRLKDLSVVLSGTGGDTESLSLSGTTFGEALNWLAGRLSGRGFDPAPLAAPIHFTLPDHALLRGAAFSIAGREAEFEELSNYYANAAAALEALAMGRKDAAPVRCWPHHFDIATSIPEAGRSVGAGFSPGDAAYANPYFYVTPWPYPDADGLPDPPPGGFWHKQGWVGAVLPGEAIESLGTAPEQGAIAMRFLQAAVDTRYGDRN
jgi:hypothetical protein